MPGFFLVSDVPNRRVVQYKRTSAAHNEGAVYIEDEAALGAPVDLMPFADKTGLSPSAGGMLYEAPYLPDAGDVYVSTQPKDAEYSGTAIKLTAAAKAGKSPYTWQWYKDDKQVVNVPASGNALSVTEPGNYFAVVTDSNGVEAVSMAAAVTVAKE